MAVGRKTKNGRTGIADGREAPRGGVMKWANYYIRVSPQQQHTRTTCFILPTTAAARSLSPQNPLHSKWPHLSCSTRTTLVRQRDRFPRACRDADFDLTWSGHATQPSSASCRRLASLRMTQVPSIPPLHWRYVLFHRSSLLHILTPPPAPARGP